MDDHPYYRKKYAKLYDEQERKKQERMFLPSSRRPQPAVVDVLADLSKVNP
jgi:hypothetical protein